MYQGRSKSQKLRFNAKALPWLVSVSAHLAFFGVAYVWLNPTKQSTTVRIDVALLPAAQSPISTNKDSKHAMTPVILDKATDAIEKPNTVKGEATATVTSQAPAILSTPVVQSMIPSTNNATVSSEPNGLPAARLQQLTSVTASPATQMQAPKHDIVKVSSTSIAAAYLQNPQPGYPSQSRRAGEQGTVLLRVSVSAQGLLQKVEVEKSSGYERLDASAKATVLQQWLFAPARRDGVAVEGEVLVPITFRL